MKLVIHVSACTSCTRTMRVRRDIAKDITESAHLLIRFNALRSIPFMPKLEHYNVDAMHAMAAAALATQAAAANARARPRLAGQCEKWLARPNTLMPYLHWAAPTPSSCPYMRPHNCPHNCPHARPQTWPGAFAQMSARFHPRYACTRARYGGWSERCDRASPARGRNAARPR